jgi:hypothetical protein
MQNKEVMSIVNAFYNFNFYLIVNRTVDECI